MTTTSAATMTTTAGHPATDRFLRAILRLDAVASGALGLLAGGAALVGVGEPLIGLPSAVLTGVGVFLLVYAAGLVALARPARILRGGVWTVVLGNAAWVLASLALAVGAWETLTVLGVVVVLAQAAAVALFAELQYAGLRRPGPGR